MLEKQTVNGVVEARSEKEIPTKFGPKQKVSFLVNGEWYGTFSNKNNSESLSKVLANDIVKIEFTANGNFKNLDTIEVVAKNVPAEVAKIKKERGAEVAKEVVASVQILADKDLKITYNGSLKSAIAFVDVAIRHDLVALPVKKSEKLDALYLLVKEFTNRFVADTYTAKLKLEPKEETKSVEIMVNEFQE